MVCGGKVFCTSACDTLVPAATPAMRMFYGGEPELRHFYVLNAQRPLQTEKLAKHVGDLLAAATMSHPTSFSSQEDEPQPSPPPLQPQPQPKSPTGKSKRSNKSSGKGKKKR